MDEFNRVLELYRSLVGHVSFTTLYIEFSPDVMTEAVRQMIAYINGDSDDLVTDESLNFVSEAFVDG